MSLPVTRNTTYQGPSGGSPGTQVKSVDLNAIQDIITGATPRLFDDFFELSGAWTTVQVAGTGTTSAPGAGSSHICTVNTTGSANDNTRLRTAAVLTKLSALPAIRARIRFIGSVASRVDGVGLAIDPTVFDAQNRLAFVRDTGSSNNLKLDVRGGSGSELFDTGFAPSLSTWYVLTAVVLNVNQVFWSISLTENGTPITSGIATLAHAITNTDDAYFRVDVTTLTGSARHLDVDYISTTVSRPA